MARRIQPSDLATMFEVYVIAVVLGALKTALDNTVPWYDATATFWAYATTFIGSIGIVGVLALSAAALARPREAPLASPGAAVSGASHSARPPKATMARTDQETEDLLQSLERIAGFDKDAEFLLEAPKAGPGTAAVPAAVEASTRGRSPQRRVVVPLIGPAVAATVFGGISAALLPGSGGYLQTMWTLNTFFVLVFAYAWGGLLAYTATSIFLASAEP